MRITILGCGGSAGVPMIGGRDGRGDWGACDAGEPRNRRMRSAIVVESEAGTRLLVDTPPDLRSQLLACAIPAIDAVLFTHSHADHITGLDEIRVLNRIAGRPLQAYGTGETLDELRLRFDYAFRPWRPPGFFRPVLEPVLVTPGETVEVAGLAVTVFGQDHHVMPTLGLRIDGFAYSTDVVRLDAEALAALAGIDTWLVGCFQRQPHPTHADVATVLRWARQLAVRRTVLTHMGTDLDWAWMQRHLPEDVEPAFDGMVLEIAAPV